MSSQIVKDGSLTLFVGEGDFSFSANYILKTCFSKEKIYATCLNSGTLSERQDNNIRIIENKDGVVYTDVDATCLESHPAIKKLKFTKIYFNFPHIPGKMNIRENPELPQVANKLSLGEVEVRFLRLTFATSAVKVLEDHGNILVTLCQGQGGTEIEKTKRKWCDTWQIVSLAASASLILNRVKFFDAGEFETYECTGFRGLQKPFNMKGALTHTFCHGKSVDLCKNNDNIQNCMNIELYLKDCENLHRIIYMDAVPPSLKILHNLNMFTKRIFTSDQVFINDLLTCGNLYFSSDSKVLKVADIDYCEDCLSNLFLNYLSKKNNNCITSIVCNICCTKNIDINRHPFPHLLCYFSDNAKSILTYLSGILEYFKLEYVFYMNREKVSDQSVNIDTSNKLVIESAIHSVQISSNIETRIKNILNLYVNYLINDSDGVLVYSVVDFFLSSDNLLNEKSDKCMKIGNVIQYRDDLKVHISILLNMDLLASLKFHVMDYRILLSRDSFYDSFLLRGTTQNVYRLPSIYPPTYIHDISFYIDKDFCENSFFIVVRNTVGYLIKSSILVDSYYSKQHQKYSRCYRFIYQSHNQALTKENANIIHTQVMRKSLEKSLNISLR